MNNEVIKKRKAAEAPSKSLALEAPMAHFDTFLVNFSSLIVVSAPVWLPSLLVYTYKKWKNAPKSTNEERRKRTLYRNLLIGMLAVIIVGPHRHHKFGDLIHARKWRVWKAWLKYVSFEVINDQKGEKNKTSSFDPKKDQAILSFVPHGIVPYGLALAGLPQDAVDLIGPFRPVIASATKLFPMGRTLMGWMNSVEANKYKVNQALSQGDRIGVCPGGISEMFENYPKPGRHPDDECVILNSRKGFIKMALKHNIPIIPIFNFGSSKLLKRWESPLLEKISNILRVSICLCFGKYGLPLAFRKRLWYVIGQALHPSDLGVSDPSYISNLDESSDEFRQYVDVMHTRFCDEIKYLFDKYKDDYGWGHRTLRIV